MLGIEPKRTNRLRCVLQRVGSRDSGAVTCKSAVAGERTGDNTEEDEYAEARERHHVRCSMRSPSRAHRPLTNPRVNRKYDKGRRDRGRLRQQCENDGKTAIHTTRRSALALKIARLAASIPKVAIDSARWMT